MGLWDDWPFLYIVLLWLGIIGFVVVGSGSWDIVVSNNIVNIEVLLILMIICAIFIILFRLTLHYELLLSLPIKFILICIIHIIYISLIIVSTLTMIVISICIQIRWYFIILLLLLTTILLLIIIISLCF